MFYSGFLYFFLCQKEGGNSVRHKLALHQPLWPISSDVSKENSMALLRVLYSFMIRFSLTLFLVMKICSATPSHCFIGGIQVEWRQEVSGYQEVFTWTLLNPERMNRKKPNIFKKHVHGIICTSTYIHCPPSSDYLSQCRESLELTKDLIAAGSASLIQTDLFCILGLEIKQHSEIWTIFPFYSWPDASVWQTTTHTALQNITSKQSGKSFDDLSYIC